ncbi:MAG: hypothetical protein HQM00_11680 [Magnetococcales bacterium]|nr:hypothetical protein [Magnetococcales bacterium]
MNEPSFRAKSNYDIPIFDFETRPVRIILYDGKPWFFANDVCSALGIFYNYEVRKQISNDEKDDVFVETSTNKERIPIISEYGVAKIISRRDRDDTSGNYRFRATIVRVSDGLIGEVFKTHYTPGIISANGVTNEVLTRSLTELSRLLMRDHRVFSSGLKKNILMEIGSLMEMDILDWAILPGKLGVFRIHRHPKLLRYY